MAKQINNVTYKVRDEDEKPNGTSYARVVHDLAFAVVTIPETAMEGRGTDSDFVGWKETAGGVEFNVQAYGDTLGFGETHTFEVEVREKRRPFNQGGRRFIYVKLHPTKEAANVELRFESGVEIARYIEMGFGNKVTVIDCPQIAHDAGIMLVPLAVDLTVAPTKGKGVTRTRRKTANA